MMNMYLTANNRFKLVLVVVSIVWLIMIAPLMIAEVWDETNGLILMETQPFAGMGIPEIIYLCWSEPIKGIYRPLATSLILLLIKLFDGNFVLLRYLVALLIPCAAILLTQALMLRFSISRNHAIAFFVILLFSASSLITATWFANIFDASCLLFLALALRWYVSGSLVACGVSFALAVFCKETCVLILPLFVWLFWIDRQRIPSMHWHEHSVLAISMLAVLGVYWWLRHSMIPTGSEADLHGFDMDVFAASYASFIAGFPTQSNSFAWGSPMFWAGVAAMIVLVVLTRDLPARLVVLAILGLCGPLYWGMFGYQSGNIMNHLDFIGRLYLIPFALILFISFTQYPPPPPPTQLHPTRDGCQFC